MLWKVVLGVTGSIAAFKGATLSSDLVKSGFDVRVVVTAGGSRFVTPLTFEAIVGNPVVSEVWDEQPGTSRMGHLELARWADILVIAPASANALARLALGMADDMLGSISLAATCPMVIAPAMETAMWHHPSTQEHVRTLQSRGARIVGPESGRLASGTSGDGRMSEPATIADVIREVLTQSRDLEGTHVLVTAGPTYEAIDPVRFLGNRSSGKMGYAIAEEARDRGATVTLVAGPTALADPSGMEVVHVESHAEMRDAALQRASRQQVIVMAAAVADFSPLTRSAHKIKRSGPASIDLVPNSDISEELSRAAPNAVHVGFALETEDLVDRAREKLRRKGQDMVIANALTKGHSPFGSSSNRVSIVTADSVVEVAEMSKRQVACLLFDQVGTLLNRSKPSLG